MCVTQHGFHTFESSFQRQFIKSDIYPGPPSSDLPPGKSWPGRCCVDLACRQLLGQEDGSVVFTCPGPWSIQKRLEMRSLPPRRLENTEPVKSDWGFPGGASGKEPACQCRRRKRCGFGPWLGKIPWRRAWQPTLVSLPGKSQGQRSLAGNSPRGCKESDMTEVT